MPDAAGARHFRIAALGRYDVHRFRPEPHGARAIQAALVRRLLSGTRVVRSVRVNETAIPAIVNVPGRTIFLFSTAAFASSVNIRVCDPLLPQVAHAFSTTPGVASGMVTAFAIAYGLLQLAWGPIGDRRGKYWVAALASIATGVFTAAGSLAETMDWLVVARFFSGAMAAAIIPLAFAWIGDAFSFATRQAVLARFLSAQFTGIVLGQAVGGFIGDVFGWRSVFLIVGAIHFLAGACMLIELKANPGAQPVAAPAMAGWRATVAAIGDLLASPWVRVMLGVVFLEAFAMYGAFAYIGADLHHRFGVGFGLVGLMLAVYGAGALTYSLTAKYLFRTLGERGLVIAGGLLIAACYALLAFAPTVAFALPAIAFMGLGFYMLHNTLQTNATQMAPQTRAIGVSMFAFFLFLGQSLGVALAAPVVDTWGAPPIYIAAAVILPVVAIWFRARLRLRPAIA
jgi:MFS transporter, YNFM family, putative membrane transport protein